MESIDEVLESLSQREIDHLCSSPTMREAFVSDMVEEYGFDKHTLTIKLNSMAPSLIQVQPAIEMKVVEPTPIWNLGGNFKTQEKKAKLLEDIKKQLNYEGLSKTGLLRAMNKDNPSWRLVCEEVLQYMVAKKIVVKMASKYYLTTNHSHRETPFHRNIYSALIEGSKSTSALLITIGYNNPKGRKKLLQALQIMVRERFVIRDGKYWKLAVES